MTHIHTPHSTRNKIYSQTHGQRLYTHTDSPFLVCEIIFPRKSNSLTRELCFPKTRNNVFVCIYVFMHALLVRLAQKPSMNIRFSISTIYKHKPPLTIFTVNLFEHDTLEICSPSDISDSSSKKTYVLCCHPNWWWSVRTRRCPLLANPNHPEVGEN